MDCLSIGILEGVTTIISEEGVNYFDIVAEVSARDSVSEGVGSLWSGRLSLGVSTPLLISRDLDWVDKC